MTANAEITGRDLRERVKVVGQRDLRCETAWFRPHVAHGLIS
jgi:hypothetical protein